MRTQAGFTLPEVLVAVLIFTLVVGGATNLLFSSLLSQRVSLQSVQLVREGSFLTEYMSRALRQAKKELNAPPTNCLNAAGRGVNYELDATKTRIRFLNKDNVCQQFFLSRSQIVEQKSSDNTAANFGAQVALTSTNSAFQVLQFALLGETQADNLQPRVTLSFEANGLFFQTSVSQRNFDVQQ